MAILNQKRILNLIPKVSAPVTIHVSQGDVGTEIEFTLVKGDELFVNPGNVSASVHGVREDGANFGAFTCTLNGSKVTFPLHSEMTAVKGSALAEIVLVDNGGSKVGSANFGIMVEESVFPLGVTYDNDVSVYESILAYVQTIPAQVEADITAAVAQEAQIRAAADAAFNTALASTNSNLASEVSARASSDVLINERIDEIIAPSGEAPSAAEVTDARIGADGITYASLGTAIRTQFTNSYNVENSLTNGIDYVGKTARIGVLTKSSTTDNTITPRDDRTAILLMPSLLVGKKITKISVYAVTPGTFGLYKASGVGTQDYSEQLIGTASVKAGWNDIYLTSPIIIDVNESIGTRSSNVGRDAVSPYNGFTYATISGTTYTWTDGSSANMYIIPYESEITNLYDNVKLLEKRFDVEESSLFGSVAISNIPKTATTSTGLAINNNRTPIFLNPELLKGKTINRVSVYSIEQGFISLYKGSGINTQDYTEELIGVYPCVPGWNDIEFDRDINFSSNESIGTRSSNVGRSATICPYEGMAYADISDNAYTWVLSLTGSIFIIPYEKMNKRIIEMKSNSFDYVDLKPVDSEGKTLFKLSAGPEGRTPYYFLNDCILSSKIICGVKVYMYEDGLFTLYKGTDIKTNTVENELLYTYSLSSGWNTVYFPEDIIVGIGESIGTKTRIAYFSDDAYNLCYANPDEYIWNTMGSFLFIPIEKLPKPQHSLLGMKLSIMGDSISTFTGTIPEGYTNYNYNGRFGMSIYDIWWKKLIKRTGMQLLINNSFGGSKVSGTDDSAASGIRATQLGTEGNNPDVIIIYMGTNDLWSGTNIGEWDGTNPIPTAVNKFITAYAVMVQKIHNAYPNARIICLTLPCYNFTFDGDELQTQAGQYVYKFNEAIEKVAKLLNCEVVDLFNCGINTYNPEKFFGDYRPSAEPPHPGVHLNASGHEAVYEKIAIYLGY